MREHTIKSTSYLGLLGYLDSIIILISAAVSYFIKFGNFDIKSTYLYFVIALIFITINTFTALSVYQGWRGRWLFREFAQISIAWFLVITILAAMTFLTRSGAEFSRVWAISTFIIAYLGFIGYRTLFRTITSHMQAAGYNQKRVIIIGAGPLGLRAYTAMQQQTWAGLQPIAFFDDENHDLPLNNIKIEGKINEAVAFIEEKRNIKPVDQVWIALPLSSQEKIEELQLALQNTATKIYFIPDLFGFNLASYSIDEMVGLPVMNMSAPPMSNWSATLKRAEDIFISFLSLILLSPLFLVVALLIKNDSKGPIFFKQRRYGQDGKEILVWKFRSMSVTENGNDIKQAARGDFRVTPIGAFLRKSSIDELPQLINVIFGSMSLVGPRPHAVAHNEFYRDKIQGYMMRHQMRPGITGWAQVNGARGETAEISDMQERIQYDLEYIRKWSIFLDIRIILMTFKTILNTKNTY